MHTFAPDMKHFSILISILLQINSLFARQDSLGKLEIVQEEGIDKIMLKHLAINAENETIDGFRIQIHFGGEREKTKLIKTKFLQQFPEVPAYEVYQQPNFKVRVGDFRTRLDAQKFMNELSAFFPSAFIVADAIHLPKLE